MDIHKKQRTRRKNIMELMNQMSNDELNKIVADNDFDFLNEDINLKKLNRLAGFYYWGMDEWKIFPKTDADISWENPEYLKYTHDYDEEMLKSGVIRFAIEDVGKITLIIESYKKSYIKPFMKILEKKFPVEMSLVDTISIEWYDNGGGYKIITNEKKINESVRLVNKDYADTKLVSSLSDLIRIIKNNEIPLRVIYDIKNNWFLVGDANKTVHVEMLNDALLDMIYEPFEYNGYFIDGTKTTDGETYFDKHIRELILFMVVRQNEDNSKYVSDGYKWLYACNGFDILARNTLIEETQLGGILRERYSLAEIRIVKDNSKNNVIKEMAYPSNFSLEEFSQLKTFKDRIEYCNKRLQKLGKGSSRIAYKVDDEKVLKIAMNRKGIAQNMHEADYFRNNFECFAKIYNADENNYTWIEMELAEKIKESDFKTLLGISFEQILVILEYMHTIYDTRYIPEMNETDMKFAEKFMKDEVYTEKNKYFYDVYIYMTDYSPKTTADWRNIRNWGVATRNGKKVPVIIDDGLDVDIWNKYYRRR